MSLSSMFAFFGFTSSTMAIEIGSKAPIVSGQDQDGKMVDLGSLYAKGITLVFFYPKAGTPGCTAEACSLRDAFEQLKERGVQIVGVSTDKIESQNKFKEKYKLPFILLSDSEGLIAKAFQVPTLLGITKRQSFLIKDGVVVWEDLKASTEQQANDVLKALNSLK